MNIPSRQPYSTLALKFCICLFTLFMLAPNSQADEFLRVVSYSGKPVPGTAGNEAFRRIHLPSISSTGQIAFRADTSPVKIDNHTKSTWLETSPSTLNKIISVGSEAPGTSNAKFENIIGQRVSSLGHTAFLGYLEDDDTEDINNSGIWAADPTGEVRLVLRGGAPATAAGEGLFFSKTLASLSFPFNETSSRFTQNSQGEIAFASELYNHENPYPVSSLWKEEENGLRLVTSTGKNAPGSLQQETFKFLYPPTLNDHGHTAFKATVSYGDNPANIPNQGIWTEGYDNQISRIARAGQEAPGFEKESEIGSTTFRLFTNPKINNNGYTTFKAGYSQQVNQTKKTGSGIWKGSSEEDLTLVASDLTPAPGTEEGVYFLNFNVGPIGTPIINASNQIAFIASLTGAGIDDSNDSGLWAEDGQGNLKLIAREGELHSSGLSFDPFFAFSRSGYDHSITLNARGQVAFKNGTSLWATDLQGDLQLIAQVGQAIDVEDGTGIEDRIIKGLYMSGNTGNQDGASTGFNDQGEFAFLATFNSYSSAVLTSTRVMIPEPSCLLLACLALTSGVFVRRREF